MQSTNRRNRFIASIALTTTAALGLVAMPGIASASPTSSVSSVTSQYALAAAAPKPAQTSAPVTGTLTGTGLPTGGVPFTGTISNLTASVVNGVLTLTGTLTGTGLPTGGVPFSVPLAALANASCTILTLDIGAIHLDLLGLVVDLAPVNLDITAVPGAGLLGNLLCAVANLLNGGGPLQGIVALLNRLLTGLGL
jgi:hypothetical protein